MLAPKKASKQKQYAYLGILIFLGLIVAWYKYSIWKENNSLVEGSVQEQTAIEQSLGLQDLSAISNISKPKYDLNKFKNFDLKLLSEERFNQLQDYNASNDSQPAVGKNNPFEKLKNEAPAGATNQ